MSRRSLGTLTIDMLMRTAGLEQGATKAERELARLNTRAVALGSAIGDAIGKGVSQLVTGLRNMTIGVAENVERMRLLSDQIGVSTEDMSRLSYAAQQMANVSDQQFGMALRRMTRRIEEAADGAGPAAAALERLGLSARELARMSPDEQFRRLADAMKSTTSQGERLRSTMAIFDTEGMPLVNMLREGADGIAEFEEEADALGVTIGDTLVRSSQAFQKEVGKLDGVKRGLSQSISAELLPSMTRWVEKFTDAEDATGRLDKASRIASTGVKLLSTVGVIVTGVFKTVGEALGGIAAVIVEMVQGNWRQALEINRMGGQDMIDNVKGIWNGLKDVWDDQIIWDGKLVNDFLKEDLGDAEETAETGGTKVVEAVDRTRQRIEDSIARIHRSLLTYGMSQDEIQLFDLEAMGADPEQLDRAARALERLTDMRRKDREEQELLELDDRSNRVLDDLNREIEGLGQSEQWHARRNALLRAGVDAQSELGRAITDTVDVLFAEGRAIDDQISIMDSFRDNIASGFADIATRSKSVGDAFRDMADNMIREVTRVMTNRMVQQLFGEQGAAGGGWFGKLMGLFGGKRATGGPVQSGKLYEVTEGGDSELLKSGGKTYLIPGSDGVVQPASAMGAGNGASVAPVFNLTIHNAPAGADVSRSPNDSGGLDINMVFRQVRGMIAQDIAEGGVVASAGKSRFGWKEQI